MATKTKRKFKLKRKFRRMLGLLIIILIIGVGCFFGLKKVLEVKQYKNTDEYKFLKKGYDEETTQIFKEKLSKENATFLLNQDRIDYVKEIVGDKYYIDKNLEKYITYYEQNSKKSFEDVVAIVNVGATKDWYMDSKNTDISLGYQILVNKFNILPEDYNPGNIKKFSSTYAFGNVSAEEECYNAFIKMADDARKENITLVLTSGYRTREDQTNIYESMKNSKGETYADEFAARPGSSEHETGLALDIMTFNAVTETFHETETYKWLHKHAREYGFIERYPENKEYLTGYERESWHFRYVGVDLANKVEEEGIAYEEYYAFYIDK